jgi:hypothetical protein
MYNETETKEANEKLEALLNRDKTKWMTDIQDLIDKIKNIRELSGCQVNMLSYRQRLLDKVTELKIMIYKRNTVWDRHFKTKYREYSLNYDLKLNRDERKDFINADMGPFKLQIKLLETHIDFYKDCIKTLDNMGFAIRNRIRLEDEE